MIGEQVAAALRAPFAVAHGRLVVGADAGGAPGHFQRFRLPQGKRVDRTGRPVPARFAMTVAHPRGLPGNLELNLAAEAAAAVGVGCAHADSPDRCDYRQVCGCVILYPPPIGAGMTVRPTPLLDSPRGADGYLVGSSAGRASDRRHLLR